MGIVHGQVSSPIHVEDIRTDGLEVFPADEAPVTTSVWPGTLQPGPDIERVSRPAPSSRSKKDVTR